MRLVDQDTGQPTTAVRGILQAQVGGQWGYVCDDGFDDASAEVACRTIYGTSSPSTSTHCDAAITCDSHLHIGGQSGNTCDYTMDDPICTDGAAASFNDGNSCQFVDKTHQNCAASEAILLVCESGAKCPPPPPIAGIRLSGFLPTSGLLEATYDGTTWGPVCDDYFDYNDHQVEVVCRQLGFLDAHGAQTDHGREFTSNLTLLVCFEGSSLTDCVCRYLLDA